MKFAIIYAGIPNATSGGSALTVWSIIKYLTSIGHKVMVYLIENLYSSPSSINRKDQINALLDLGVKIVSFDSNAAILPPKSSLSKLSRLFVPKLQDYYPTNKLSHAICSSLQSDPPQAIFVYHFESLAAVYQLRDIPMLAAVVDPTHLPMYYRWRKKIKQARSAKEYLRISLETLTAMIWLPRYMRTMMLSCACSGAFAAHHAAWFRKIGVSDCQYFRTPVIDEVGSGWEAKRQRFKNKTKFKVLLIGHLKGTATLSGLYLFARDVLPILEKQLGPDKLEVHIVGGYTPPDDLRRLLNRQTVKMRGQIEPATDEFLSSDVLVVPTPIKLGTRVRIITGFSFGCCVVSHYSNTLGIPEMIDQKNALLAKDGKSMAEAILRALNDRLLRERLGAEARKTFEENFALPVAGRKIVTELERIAQI